MKIYIAGPYMAPNEPGMLANVKMAMDAGLRILKKGHAPHIPHLSHFVDQYAKANDIPMEYRDYMDWDNVWLRECDAILVLAESPGVQEEIEEARKYELQFFYSVKEIPDA